MFVDFVRLRSEAAACLLAAVVASGCSSSTKPPPVVTPPPPDTATVTDADPITPEQVDQSANNIKQIGSAGHGYHDQYQRLPANIADKDGKPLLSWRVQLLPLLKEDALYKEFKLDEPWDSEHNKKLIEKMPKVFVPVRRKTNPGETFYQGFAGQGTVWEPGHRSHIAEIRDGTSNTIWVVEAGSPVTWTKPEDLPFDVNGDLPKLGGLFNGEFHILLVDGRVSLAKKAFDPVELKKAITRDGLEVVDFTQIWKSSSPVVSRPPSAVPTRSTPVWTPVPTRLTPATGYAPIPTKLTPATRYTPIPTKLTPSTRFAPIATKPAPATPPRPVPVPLSTRPSPAPATRSK